MSAFARAVAELGADASLERLRMREAEAWAAYAAAEIRGAPVADRRELYRVAREMLEGVDEQEKREAASR